MVGLASDLKMQTTAEGVETQEELQLVRDLGCSLVQGYIFGKPMPAEEARELAAKGAATRPAQLPSREPRVRIIRAALLHYNGEVRGARLRNISSGGALIECREEMPTGAVIQLDFAAGGLIEAEIRWSKGTQFESPVQGKVQPEAASADQADRQAGFGAHAELSVGGDRHFAGGMMRAAAADPALYPPFAPHCVA